MLRRVLEDENSKALLILPYVALVQEKVRWLRKIVQGIKRSEPDPEKDAEDTNIWRKRADENTIRVAGILGGARMRYTFSDFDIAVCTIEKASWLHDAAICLTSVGELAHQLGHQ